MALGRDSRPHGRNRESSGLSPRGRRRDTRDYLIEQEERRQERRGDNRKQRVDTIKRIQIAVERSSPVPQAQPV